MKCRLTCTTTVGNLFGVSVDDERQEQFNEKEIKLLLQQGVSIEGVRLENNQVIVADNIPSINPYAQEFNTGYGDEYSDYDQEIEEELIEEIFEDDDAERAIQLYNSLDDTEKNLLRKWNADELFDSEWNKLFSKITEDDAILIATYFELDDYDEYSDDEDDEYYEDDEEEYEEIDEDEVETKRLWDNLTDEQKELMKLYYNDALPKRLEQKLFTDTFTKDDADFLIDNMDLTLSDEDIAGIVEEYDSKVKKLYTMLGNEKAKIYKNYYMWFTRHIFENSDKVQSGQSAVNSALKKKRKDTRRQDKLDDMAKLREKSDNWVYGGMVDLGAVLNRGLDPEDKNPLYQCDYGHDLRYVHIAWDANYGDIDDMFFVGDLRNDYDIESKTSVCNVDYENITESEHSIKFGSTCLVDFFEVSDADSKEVIKELMAVQNIACKDLEALYDIYTSPNYNYNDYFNTLALLDEIVTPMLPIALTKRMAQKGSEPINVFLLVHYNNMRKAQLLPPQSLVQNIRDFIAGWYKKGVDKPDRIRFIKHRFKAAEEFKFVSENETLSNTLFKERPEIIKYLTSYKDRAGSRYNSDFSSLYKSVADILSRYLVYALTYKIAGFYEYNGHLVCEARAENKEFTDIKRTDEGGSSKKYKIYYDSLMKYFHNCTFSKDEVHSVVSMLIQLDDIYSDLTYFTEFKVDFNSDLEKFVVVKKVPIDIDSINRYSQVFRFDVDDNIKTYSNLLHSLNSFYHYFRFEDDNRDILVSVKNLLDTIKSGKDKYLADYEMYAGKEAIKKNNTPRDMIVSLDLSSDDLDALLVRNKEKVAVDIIDANIKNLIMGYELNRIKTYSYTRYITDFPYNAKVTINPDMQTKLGFTNIPKIEELKASVVNAIRNLRVEYQLEQAEKEKAEKLANQLKQKAEETKQSKAEVSQEDIQAVLDKVNQGKELTSDSDILTYIASLDLSNETDPTLLDCIKVYNAWKTSSYPTPTSSMMTKIKNIYLVKAGLRKSLTSNQTYVDAVEWALANKDEFDAKTYSILTSIKRYGFISERQQKYLDEAVTKYNNK